MDKMINYKKAQISVEMVIISIAVLSMFLSIFYLIDHRNDEIEGIKDYLNAKDEADRLAWNINEVYIAGYGSVRQIYVSNVTRYNTPINLSVFSENRFVRVEWGERFYTSPLVTSRVSGNLTGVFLENFSLTQGLVNISNVLGEIKIEQ